MVQHARGKSRAARSSSDEDEHHQHHKVARHHVLGTQTSTNAHLTILVVLIMLSFDEMNPVKRISSLVCRSCSTEDTGTLGWLFVFFLLWAVLNDLHNVVYYAARIFFNSIVSIFISKVDVIGLENVPFRGPVILAANHSNQFVDGAVLCCSCPHRKVGILIAKKSYDNPVIGFLARAMAAVPISRPQDLAEPGAGVLLNLSKHERAGRCSQVSNASPDASPAGGPVDDEVFRLVGSSACDFTVQLTRGDKISYLADRRAAHGRRSGGTWMWRVVEVESSCACMVTLTSAPTGLLGATAASRADELDVEGSLPADGRYRIFPRGDHERVFDEVFASLGRGACIGIFPEGGSHDRTDLLDLKPGVALMALGATTTTPVPIVPVGLSYFRGHLFRNAKVCWAPALAPWVAGTMAVLRPRAPPPEALRAQYEVAG